MPRFRAVAVLVVVVLLAPILAASDPLTTIDAVRRLTADQAAQGLPVRIEAVVTYYHHDWEMLFLQDATGAIFAYVDHRKPPFPVRLGQRAIVEGKTVPGDFVASIGDIRLTPLPDGKLPTAPLVGLKEMSTGAFDARWIEARGVVRAAAIVDDLLQLTVMTADGKLRVHVKDWEDQPDYGRLVDSAVRVRGVCTSLTNGRRQFLGAEVWSPTLEQLVVEEPASAEPFQTPALSVDNLRRRAFGGGQGHRVKVLGTVTLQQPARGLFLEDGHDALFVQTAQKIALQPGQRVEVLGFIANREERAVLEDATVRVIDSGPLVVPVAVSARKALEEDEDGRLIQTAAHFVGRIVSGGEPALVFEDGDVVFNARMPSPEEPPMLIPGSLVQVTGICSVRRGEGRGPQTLEVLLRSAADLAVRAQPSWWTEERVRWGLELMTGGVLAALVWVGLLRRRVRQQTTTIRERLMREAALERESREELARKDAALRESQERFALAVQGTNDGVWDWDLRADTIYFSPRWKAMLGYGEDEVGATPADWFRLVHPEDIERLRLKLTQHREGQTSQFEDEHRMLDRDNTYRWVLSRGFASRDAEGVAYRLTGAQTDVTDRRSYDPLTGLPNRALFVERLERAMARAAVSAHRFAVLFLDLDRFKVINDSLGHLAGDRLLVTFARRLEGCVRPGDMVARFGGDEFAILIDGITGPHDAAAVAERIQKALAESMEVGGHEVYTSASIGIALSNGDVRDSADLLRDADTAMYRAKSAGRARFEVFDAVMRDAVTVFMRTESELRRALERGELRVHYQPIVNLATGVIVAFEALLRWEHPERGLLRPQNFLAVAEETGLMVPIGLWALREACQQAATWRECGPAGRPRLCVNLSARQITAGDLVEDIRTALLAADLPAERLVLEVTESSLLDPAGAALARIEELKSLGIGLHLDDFGTGYSSLSYLYRLPIDALKIDRSFIVTMSRSEQAFAIVRSIVSLAASLKLTVVAEGIETEAQAGHLRDLGCAAGQGFYFCDSVEPAVAAALASGSPVAKAQRTFTLPKR
jgi:diguanylate cyclase (GGDEF)-like protein/PAS domain S-box-containing protein